MAGSRPGCLEQRVALRGVELHECAHEVSRGDLGVPRALGGSLGQSERLGHLVRWLEVHGSPSLAGESSAVTNPVRVESIPLNAELGTRTGERRPNPLARCASGFGRCEEGQQLEVMSLSSSPVVVEDEVEDVEVDGFFVFGVVEELFDGVGSGGLIDSSTIAWILA